MVQTTRTGEGSGTAPVQGLSSWMGIPLWLWEERVVGRSWGRSVELVLGMAKGGREKLFTLLAQEPRSIKWTQKMAGLKANWRRCWSCRTCFSRGALCYVPLEILKVCLDSKISWIHSGIKIIGWIWRWLQRTIKCKDVSGTGSPRVIHSPCHDCLGRYDG